MQTVSTETQTEKPRKSDKFIPWYFVAFFVALFIWDGIFVYTATSTHTGVVEDNTYNRGLNYNETVAAADRQAALGWQSNVTLSREGTLSFALENAEGKALRGANVKAQFFRPTQAGQDFIVGLQETGSGTYQTVIRTIPGQWEVRVFVRWKQQRYQTSKRIIVQQ